MEFVAEAGGRRRRRSDCTVVGMYEGGKRSAAAKEFDRVLGGRLARVVRDGDFAGRLADTLLLPDLGPGPAARVLLVGLGRRAAWSRRAYRRAALAAAQALVKCGAREATLLFSADAVPDMDAYYRARVAAEAVEQARYRIPDLKSGRRPAAPRLRRVRVLCADRAELAAAKRGLEHGAALAAGSALARDLGNLPPNVCTPRHLGNVAKRLAREHPALRVRVLGPAHLRRLGMGAFLAVTRGAAEPPRLIVLEYRGGRPGEAPVALVGKGVTFDSGGISLKEPPGMDEMKFDMSGAASVLGTLKALALVGARLNAVGVIAACENMPGGRATRPGDIVTSMSGQTIEILNTDAEGRLILCDALTYARRFHPAIVIDVATLTGACVIALGQHLSAVMSNDEPLAAELIAAGRRASDPCWQMPLADEYQEQLKSNFADFANVAGREGGALTAAAFLWKFTAGLRWAHLDIAGTAYLSGANKGSTGRPVPLLVDFLLSRA